MCASISTLSQKVCHEIYDSVWTELTMDEHRHSVFRKHAEADSIHSFPSQAHSKSLLGGCYGHQRYNGRHHMASILTVRNGVDVEILLHNGREHVRASYSTILAVLLIFT